MKTLITLLLLSLLCACGKTHVEEAEMIDTSAIVSENELNDTINYETNGFLQRDSLLITWYDNLIAITHTDLNFHSEKKTEANRFVSGQIDTIERLTFKESNIEIYRTPDKNILMSAEIRNAEIALSKEMKVGISKQELLQYLNTESQKDTLHVIDFEGNTNVMLILKDNLLTRIVYSGYVD